ncbi:MAG TPA: phosphoribosylformylglycinamidine cyclo-ligase [Thermomicrobiales bacterium]|nr:phosphoribosylformylglycinamidine cyclo-ligase [Thermomicrobiales bacterium]
MTTYADSGVHLAAARDVTSRLADIVRGARTSDVLADVGAFGGMFALDGWGGMARPVLVASADGVGTKAQVAATLGRLDGLGFDIVNHCVNDIAVQGAQPLFFLDYLAMHRTEPATVAALVEGVAAACRTAGMPLLGGETAEMPDVYAPGDFDLAGFIVGIADRDALGHNGSPAAGDLLLGLPSCGLHTNGYSLARRALPAGAWDRFEPELGTTIGEALLVPHRSYLREIEALTTAGARAFAHITGGGFPDNVARILPESVTAKIDCERWRPPAIFRLIAEAGGVPEDEMYRVFNMGIGLVAVVPSDRRDAALAIAPEAIVIGRVTRQAGAGEPVALIGEHGGI